MAIILSISIPQDLRVALDAESERQRRSRSFVVAEAVREYLAGRERDGFDDARERTLRQSLALSPDRRVQLAEELWQEFARDHRLTRPWTAGFETFDDYERWRRAGPGPAR
jgi:hypothetical protein